MNKGWSLLCGIAICLVTGCATSARQYDSPYGLTQDRATKAVKSRTLSRSVTVRTPVPVSGNSNGRCTHVVQKGDTMYSLAFASNMELSELAAINGIPKPYHINVGQRLMLGRCGVQPDTRTSVSSGGTLSGSANVYHVVRKGETLFSISRQHGLTVAALKKLNNLKTNEIEIGQRLALGKGAGSINNQNMATPVGTASVRTSIASSNSSISSAPGMRTTVSTSTVAPAVAAAAPKPSNSNVKPAVSSSKGLAWQWPTTSSGKIIQKFSTGEHGNKGIDISDKRGSPVKSAASGKVVYAGNALRGYGNLIIINHNDDYLSAYAHNDSILVTEGTQVKAGQTIAKMGDTEANSVRLHFEIRYRGQSVNPLNFLPARR